MSGTIATQRRRCVFPTGPADRPLMEPLRPTRLMRRRRFCRPFRRPRSLSNGTIPSSRPGAAGRLSLPDRPSFAVSHSLRTVDECIGLFSRTRKQTIAPGAIFCALLKVRSSRLRHRLLERHRDSLSARLSLFGRRTVSVPDTWPLIFLPRTDLPTGTSGPPLTTSTRCSTNSAPTRSTP